MRIVFIGPPGAGKGTQSLKVASALGITHLSTGEVLREANEKGTPLGLRAKEYLDNGCLVPDDVVVELVAERLDGPDCERGYLFDGFPRTLPQAEILDRLLRERGLPLDGAVLFEIGEAELFRRLAERGRSDDDGYTIRKRLRDYAALTEPVAQYYTQQQTLHRIDAVGTQQEVFDRISRSLGFDA